MFLWLLPLFIGLASSLLSSLPSISLIVYPMPALTRAQAARRPQPPKPDASVTSEISITTPLKFRSYNTQLSPDLASL
ncbi:hypothetical protein BC939DRAFT_456857 [Gamsiella multidivaricata]|uniref:uncharacterized protein n=1 Tax=Gamsiella multidivaricata TaxID=101098 RepID=UPI0022207839|nr:uncharacterized protein BC939DRAFT_456857 [Gamsiella multidivaricata]KAI7821013.1 hypothetical protein BC939DRAFT_456857 [Gamsiella multidivaricata]